MIEIITALGVGIGLIAGGLQIWQHFRPSRKSEILNPGNGAECGGRIVTVSGVAPRRRRHADYWVAIQPSNCRGSGTWWPQRQSLVFGPRGTWILERATLGRQGEIDIGVTFTIGLFEVLSGAREKFAAMAKQGERLKLADVADHCNQLHSIEVKRVG